MTSPNSKSTLIAQCQAIINGLPTLNVTEYTLGGKAFAKTDLNAVFQAYVDAANASATAKKSSQNAIDAEDAAGVTARSTRALLQTFLKSHFGKTSPELTTFGFAPNKTAKKTVEVKAVAVERAAATRKARNTMGKKQKKKIRGTVTVLASEVGEATSTPEEPATAAPAEKSGNAVQPTAAAAVPAPAGHPASGS